MDRGEIMKTILKIIFLFTFVGFVSCSNEKQERMVDFNDYQIHMKEIGHGRPTVIIEAGLGSGLDAYDNLQIAVSKLTKVLSYDRPGLGDSGKSPNPRTLPVYVDELKKLLNTEEIAPPYILVGHSLGGLIIRYFAHQFPEEVVGLVFIDCLHEDWFEYIRTTHSDKEVEAFNRAIDQNLNQSTGVTKEEWIQFEPNCDLIRGIDIPQHIPIRMITATQFGRDQEMLGYHPEDMLAWAEMQATIMNNVEDANQIITDKSGHSIHLTEPDLIINSIKELVENYRKR